MRRFLLTTLMAAFSLSILADETYKFLMIWVKDGTMKKFPISEKPKLTFTSSAFIVTVKGQQTVFPLGKIRQFTYEKKLMGDANSDGKVDIADVTVTIMQIQGHSPSPFSFEEADMNGDMKIDYDDVNGIINVIMKKNNPPVHEGILDDLDDLLG